jgi:flagellar motor switch protein FliM
MTHRPYNFRKPARLAGTLEQRLTAWLRVAGQLAAVKAARHLPFRIEMAPRGLEIASPSETLSRLTDDMLGYKVAFAGEPPTMLFMWPRRLALALVAGLLGETPTELPEDRELSAVELSLFEYLMQNLPAVVLQETWTGSMPLRLTVSEREPSPRWTRLFVKAEQVLQCNLTIRGAFGEQDWYWLAPYQALNELVNRPGEDDPALIQQDAPRKLETLVRDLPIEVIVELGMVELSLAQLAGLAVGDLLILNQRVSEPLTIRVDNRPKFRGWPGRVGTRQSLQIESLGE